jgi:hypothetical protein
MASRKDFKFAKNYFEKICRPVKKAALEINPLIGYVVM